MQRVGRLVKHGRRGIDHQHALYVGLLLEALDVVLVAFGEDLPVDVPDLVAGGILFVFGELDAGAVMRTFVQTAQGPVGSLSGPEVQRLEPREQLGIE